MEFDSEVSFERAYGKRQISKTKSGKRHSINFSCGIICLPAGIRVMQFFILTKIKH
ncbi:hypothetical protein [Candidatus Endomicrobiellum trichonymphae]|uniref:hypothetical protein n=1 Tax=Endomicrobium trichonymphae TaxID=1408204 RepID=UPI001551B15E|nr:hypothetical protein [Candidatus Endomicrobium trichonymphae]